MKKQEQLTKEQLMKLYKLLENKILENKNKFEEKRFKDDELIQLLLETILLEEKRTRIGIIKYIDFKNIDMAGQNLIYLNMTGTNINFDPQTIKYKDLQHAVLYGDFEGKSFDGVLMYETNCENAKNINLSKAIKKEETQFEKYQKRLSITNNSN